MNNLKNIIAIIAISLTTTFYTTASEKVPSAKNNNLRSEIVSLLGDNIPLELKKETEAEISILINNKNEIIVVSVDCSSNQFNSFVKRKLNYKKLTVKGTKKGEIYRIPVKINL